MPGILKKIAITCWRIWFYLLTALPILVFFPVLLLLTLTDRTYPQFYWMARNLWALPILYGIGCFPRIRYREKLQKGQSYLLVANHTSVLDIMLMLRTSPYPFVFVGKKELVTIPVFGFFYKRVCILVDRESTRSRTGVYIRAQRRIASGLSVCIFPEGGVPPPEIVLDHFKDGAFKMSITHQIPLVPISFYDTKKRFPFEFFEGGPGPLRVEVHPFLYPGNLNPGQYEELKEKTRNILLDSLVENGKKKGHPVN